MVIYLGKLYGKFLSHDEAGKLVKHILLSVGWIWGATALGLKFFAEVLKGAGVITMGGTTVAGMALDAGLAGAVAYALGFHRLRTICLFASQFCTLRSVS